MTVLLLTRDLAVISQADGAAARNNIAIQTVSSEADAVDRCVELNASLIIVDLGMPSLDIESLVAQLQAAIPTLPRLMAFGPHVHTERLAAARAAGFDSVISRGQFFAQLDVVLAGIK